MGQHKACIYYIRSLIVQRQTMKVEVRVDVILASITILVKPCSLVNYRRCNVNPFRDVKVTSKCLSEPFGATPEIGLFPC